MENKEKKRVVRKKKIPKKHIVVFQDAQGNVLKTIFVNDGESAEAPQMEEVLEEKEHHKVVFEGWNQEFDKVHANLVICPIYKEIPKEYLVMYFHENGKILGTETVLYGQAAKQAIRPEKDETEEFRYHFEGWSTDLSNIEKDQMAKAVFKEERKSFHVHFFDGEDQLIKDELVYYGEAAHAPENMRKEADFTYRYYFEGWDSDFSSVKEEKDVHAIFGKEYILYTVRFYEEEKCIEEKNYHYQENIELPVLWKKGYDFIWEDAKEKIENSLDIHGHWEYSNPKGKQEKVKNGIYEIVNPSISAGTVRCIGYHSDEEIIHLPSQIKLGDYYYEVESIAGQAFAECKNVRKIVCPHSVKILEDRCFYNNTKLENIIFGKGLKEIGAYVFEGCRHLKSIHLQGKKSLKINRYAFEKINPRVECKVRPDQYQYIEARWGKMLSKKQVILR